MRRELILVNTLGLTGSEILAGALSHLQGVRILPGQNFIQFGAALYRPHDYAGATPEVIFASLNQEQTMRNGRIWVGLTKLMGPAERAAYDRAGHAREFAARLGPGRGFLECVRAYAEAYFASAGQPLAPGEAVAIAGGNFLLNHGEAIAADDRVQVIDVAGSLYTWLAAISQRMTFDCVQAAEFWFVNRLWLADYTRRHSRIRQVRLEEYAGNPANFMRALGDGLGRTMTASATVQPGTVRFDPAQMAQVLHDAAALRRIYGPLPVFVAAENFDMQVAGWLATPGMEAELAHYGRYWNTTGHTNFDVIGPVEEKILRLAGVAGLPADLPTSVWFYHRAVRLHSDCYNAPEPAWFHPLGCLEDEVELPALPYFIKATVGYVRGLLGGYALFLHSYIPVRQQRLYRMLQAPEVRRKAVECGIADWIDGLEAQINQVEARLQRGEGN